MSSYFSLDNKINIVDPVLNQGKSVLFLLLQQRHFDLHLHSIWQTEKAALFLSSEKHVYAVVTHDFLQREMTYSSNSENCDTRAGLKCSVMCLFSVISTDIDFCDSDLRQRFH